MGLMDLIRSRRSVRKFKDKDVGSDEVRRILEAGRWAPSAGNLESRDYIVVRDRDVKQGLMRAAGQSFIGDAPVLIVVCANMERSSQRYGDRGYNLYSVQDATAAVQNMLLMAHNLGLASCWIGAFDEDEVQSILDIPGGVRPVTILPVGHPAEQPSPPERSSLDKFVHKDEW
ncbi:nitroreductase family protein [Methanonatronarchaeum sp. AMET6-2]|uniref:nitroreductase family protein n=1 Tax=Methanonatronarchaeum sp. AMET6-2 TaxID=2933293 RepID=UPI00122BC556|nr:nitroreductase family protein [Methanonatronarchaeum sp. AMET6-2]RZN62133.1 MAG: nitroreductase family protein [Methanonatronarchaeia archaeon]UOY09650.1 nitroreductase family protein [Methanonatronarchaeum sp. AMET6-2]